MTAPSALPVWNDMAFFDLVTIKSGQVDPRSPAYRNLPLIAPDHLASQTGRLLKKESAAAQCAISGKYLVRPGDVIYSKIRPYLQKAYKCDFDALCSADMYPFTPRPGVDASFVLHSILGRDFTNFAKSVSARSGIPKINRVELSEYRMAVPPPSEQRAIGRALDDADDLIAALQQVIAKKRAVKQGMMQQLLTGRTRLPGFCEQWQLHALGELGSFSKGAGLAKSELADSGRLPAVPYTAIFTDYSETFDARDIGLRTSVRAATIDRPHVLIAASSNMLENVGKATAYLGQEPIAVGGDVLIYKTVADVAFVSYLLNSRPHRQRIVDLAQGSTIRHVYRSTFVGYQIESPSYDEQRAIASVIASADHEIRLLRDRLTKARQVKQGMMQQLLTGGRRLPAGIAI